LRLKLATIFLPVYPLTAIIILLVLKDSFNFISFQIICLIL